MLVEAVVETILKTPIIPIRLYFMSGLLTCKVRSRQLHLIVAELTEKKTDAQCLMPLLDRIQIFQSSTTRLSLRFQAEQLLILAYWHYYLPNLHI